MPHCRTAANRTPTSAGMIASGPSEQQGTVGAREPQRLHLAPVAANAESRDHENLDAYSIEQLSRPVSPAKFSATTPPLDGTRETSVSRLRLRPLRPPCQAGTFDRRGSASMPWACACERAGVLSRVRAAARKERRIALSSMHQERHLVISQHDQCPGGPPLIDYSIDFPGGYHSSLSDLL
eukprot:1746948-Prymnesium_polylepis.3